LDAKDRDVRYEIANDSEERRSTATRVARTISKFPDCVLPKADGPIIKLNAAMVPKRTKVFICKSPFSFASGVADARSKNTLQDELFPNDAVQKRNPYEVMLAAHTSKTFHSQEQG